MISCIPRPARDLKLVYLHRRISFEPFHNVNSAYLFFRVAKLGEEAAKLTLILG